MQKLSIFAIVYGAALIHAQYKDFHHHRASDGSSVQKNTVCFTHAFYQKISTTHPAADLPAVRSDALGLCLGASVVLCAGMAATHAQSANHRLHA